MAIRKLVGGLAAVMIMAGVASTEARAETAFENGDGSWIDEFYRNIQPFYRNIVPFYRNIVPF